MWYPPGAQELRHRAIHTPDSVIRGWEGPKPIDGLNPLSPEKRVDSSLMRRKFFFVALLDQ